LLLNSIYGKSILKPIETTTKVLKKDKFPDWLLQNYNFVKEVNESPDCKHVYAKCVKHINKHFNLPQFGVGVLSWSKHIMNEVMCMADDLKMNVYYQDTDSLHIDESNVKELAQVFKLKYGRDLIESDLGQFHCDFTPLSDAPVWSKRLITLGKKCYLDCLEDAKGNSGYHFRMKGVPQAVLTNYCANEEITLEQLYLRLYDGEEITFNLLDGSLGFRKSKTYEQFTPQSFTRMVCFRD
jgi:hypothetical protein